MPSQFPSIHAHRGYAQLAPENTLPAFQLCIDHNIEFVELDIHQTTDKQLIVYHDYYLGRTASGTGLVFNKKYSDLQNLDVGIWFSPQYVGTKIPLLKEVIQLCKNKCRFEIQLTSSNLHFLRTVLQLLDSQNIIDQVEITSDYSHALMKVRELKNKIRTGLILSPGGEWMKDDLWTVIALDTLELIGANVAHIPLTRLNKNTVLELRNQNYIIHAADCNTAPDITKAIQLEVDQFSTDNVRLALEMRNKHKETA